MAAGVAVSLLITGMWVMSPSAYAGGPASVRPVMGYNPWYQYGVEATEDDVLRQAKLLVSTGLAAAGYDYVNLDDGWMATKRTASGALTWSSARFPHGIAWLAAE